MREIKFRAWDKVNSNMIYSQIWISDTYGERSGVNGSDGSVGLIFKSSRGLEIKEVKNQFILQQYTGLKDKNGKEIYEHDVILLKDKDYEEKNETAQALSTYEFHCVEFKYGCFKIGGVNLGDYIDGKYLDIIQCGNIYENKEVYRVEEKILSHGEDMNITDITFNISNKK